MNRFNPDQIDTIEAAIRNDGYVIIEGALTPDQLNQINSEFDTHFKGAHDGHDDFMGYRTVRFGALLEKSTAVQDLILHPTVLEMANRILLPYCLNYHIHYTGVMRLMPGEKAQSLHRDTGIFPVANPSPPLTMATMWALDNFTREKGGTVVIPGSHQWQDERNPVRDEVMYTEMPAGSVLVYTGNVIHGGGDNLSDEYRTGLAIHYGLGWLRQEENQFLACSAQTARTLPERLQALLGYELAAPSFGFVDHIHPRDYLHGVRNPADSNVATRSLRQRQSQLTKLSMTEQPSPPDRFYKIAD